MARKHYEYLDKQESKWLGHLWLPFCVIVLLLLALLVLLLTWEPPIPIENIERALPDMIFTGHSVPPPEQ